MLENIADILNEERLLIHLQPILSLHGRTLFGFEALVRGVTSEGVILPPSWLFLEAEKAGLTTELDRQARYAAIHTFAPLWKENPKLLLFVNFESKLIDGFKLGDYLFDGILKSIGIPYANIVLEIKEDEISDTSRLKEFCDHYRDLGFNIALDDFGVGQSSFDRLGIVRPDIIKIDRSLIDGIEHNYIHQEVVHAICNMCRNLGSIALAEGVETLEEATWCTYLGATLVQGFWFARPSSDPIHKNFSIKVDQVKLRWHQMMANQKLHHEMLRTRAESLCHDFNDTIVNITNIMEWAEYFGKNLDNYPDIEALYLIDSHAKQIGSTLLRCTTRAFFEPTADGYDHSYKEYYLRAIESSDGFYLTGRYLSLASGNSCRTYSRTLTLQGKQYVFCIDFME